MRESCSMDYTYWDIICYIFSALTRPVPLAFLLISAVYQIMVKPFSKDADGRNSKVKQDESKITLKTFKEGFSQIKEKITGKKMSCLSDSNSSSIDYIGLPNEGNTCYLNALLQCLYLTPEFRDRFCTEEFPPTIFSAIGSIFFSLESKYETVTTCHLTPFLDRECFRQQDVPEIFHLILSKLDETASHGPSFKEIYASTLVSSMECKAGHYKDGYQAGCDIVILPLAVSSSCDPKETWSVDKAVVQFQSTKEMTEENQIYCDDCSCKMDTKLWHTFTKLPQILVVQLKRFEYSYGMKRFVKLNDEIIIGRTLEVKCEINKHTGTKSYELFAICDHHGDHWGGHYTALIKPRHCNSWYYFNDRRVEKVSLQQKYERSCSQTSEKDENNLFRSRTAYLLMYRQKPDGVLEENKGGPDHVDPSPPEQRGASVQVRHQWGSQDITPEEHTRESKNEKLHECHSTISENKMPQSITCMDYRRTTSAETTEGYHPHKSGNSIVSEYRVRGHIANEIHRKASPTGSQKNFEPETSHKFHPSKYKDTLFTQEQSLSLPLILGDYHPKTHHRLVHQISQDRISNGDHVSVRILAIKEEYEHGDSKQKPCSARTDEFLNGRANTIITPRDSTRVTKHKIRQPIPVQVTLCHENVSGFSPTSSKVSIARRNLKKASPHLFPEHRETPWHFDHRITSPQSFNQNRNSPEDESILSRLHNPEYYYPQRSQESITPEMQAHFRKTSLVLPPENCSRASSKEIKGDCCSRRATQINTYGDTRVSSPHKSAGPIILGDITCTHPRRASPQMIQEYYKTSTLEIPKEYCAQAHTQIQRKSKTCLSCILPTCLRKQCLHAPSTLKHLWKY